MYDDPVLSLLVVRTGGFAGLRRTWQVRVAAESEATRWWPLVEACPWGDVADTRGADRFVYEVRANGRAAVLGEQQLSGPWADLVTAVQAAADIQQ